MRSLLPLTIILFACQTTAPAPTPEDLQAALEVRSLEVAEAVQSADLDRGLALASESAAAFFEAQKTFRALLGDEEDIELERDSGWSFDLVRAEQDGQAGVAVLLMTSTDEQFESKGGEEPMTSDMILHFVLEQGEWRLDGFAEEVDAAPTRLADMTADILAMIETIEQERVPHPGAGPVIEAYFAAASERSLAGMTANMTAACREAEGRSSSFTSAFASGELKVTRWSYDGLEDHGDGTVLQRVRALLLYGEGETDNEPMRFTLQEIDGAWTITDLN